MLAEIHRLLESAGAERLVPELPVWELAAPRWPFSRRARRAGRVREAILRAALALPGPTYLVTGENPQAYDLGGPWARAGERTWPVPESCPADALLARVLASGEWSIYNGPRPLDAETLPDAFRVPPAQLVEFALSNGLPFLAQAGRDGGTWRLQVEELDRQQRVAA